MADSFNTSGQCQCGHARFSISGRPLVRGFCHCLICQAFNQAAFADITVFYARDVHLHDESTVAFRAHQQPPMLKRGCCTQCGKPAIERLNIPLMPALVVIPTANLSDPSLAPQSALHIFYNRRQADVDDGLPKYCGYLSSQTHFGIAAIKAMLSRR